MSMKTLLGVIQRLQSDVRAVRQRTPSAHTWATVMDVNPLTLLLDTATDGTLVQGVENAAGPLGVGDRVVTEYRNRKIWVYGPHRQGTAVDWIPITPSPDFEVHAGVTPRYKIVDGVLYMQGAIAPKTGTYTTSYAAITEPLTELAGVPSLDWKTSSNLAGQGARFPLRGYIHADTLQIMVAAISSTILTPSAYTTLTGFSGKRID